MTKYIFLVFLSIFIFLPYCSNSQSFSSLWQSVKGKIKSTVASNADYLKSKGQDIINSKKDEINAQKEEVKSKVQNKVNNLANKPSEMMDEVVNSATIFSSKTKNNTSQNISTNVSANSSNTFKPDNSSMIPTVQVDSFINANYPLFFNNYNTVLESDSNINSVVFFYDDNPNSDICRSSRKNKKIFFNFYFFENPEKKLSEGRLLYNLFIQEGILNLNIGLNPIKVEDFEIVIEFAFKHAKNIAISQDCSTLKYGISRTREMNKKNEEEANTKFGKIKILAYKQFANTQTYIDNLTFIQNNKGCK